MDEALLHRFEQLIAARTGLQLRPREHEALRDALAARMASLRLDQADEYYRLLQAGRPDVESEWDQLIARLTNNESYFFRDKGQMTLLRERILPELIARNQERRTLRLWSAGCSTGEEPYSLAMLVDELLPQRRAVSASGWEIVILGTDIDEQALQKARRGMYGSWSFRTMEAAQQQRYFQRQGDGWQVAEATRSVVTFVRCNLVSDSIPSTMTGIHDMDLILCRNVFIYFERKAVSAVLPKFAQTLREGGYLMTGHAETQGRLAEPLQARMFPESVVYQRVSKASIGVEAPASVAQKAAGTAVGRTTAARSQPPAEAPSRRPPPVTERAAPAKANAAPPEVVERALAEAEARYAAGDYQAVLRTLQPLQETASERACLLLAHAHANLGHHEEATGCCERLMKARPFAAEPYELLASIAQEQGRYDEAKLLLKKALYLVPSAPASYLELGELYRRESDTARARTMYLTALELLEQRPAEAAVGSYGGPTVHEWILYLKQLLAEGE
jgi:chemotaxis protein methyltransferase CheR